MSRIIGRIMVAILVLSLLAVLAGAGVALEDQTPIFLVILFGSAVAVICAFGGAYLLTKGSSLNELPLPNRAYKVLSINQFKEDGAKYFLLVPLAQEDERPIYYQLSPNRIPGGVRPGDVIINIAGKIKLFVEKELIVE